MDPESETGAKPLELQEQVELVLKQAFACKPLDPEAEQNWSEALEAPLPSLARTGQALTPP